MQEIVFHVSGSKLGFWIPLACNLSKFIKVKTQQRLFKKQIKPFPIESLSSKKDPPPPHVRKTNDGYLSTRSLPVVWYNSLVNINSAPVSHKTQQPPVGEKFSCLPWHPTDPTKMHHFISYHVVLCATVLQTDFEANALHVIGGFTNKSLCSCS